MNVGTITTEKVLGDGKIKSSNGEGGLGMNGSDISIALSLLAFPS
jgi:hypothetical protein